MILTTLFLTPITAVPICFCVYVLRYYQHYKIKLGINVGKPKLKCTSTLNECILRIIIHTHLELYRLRSRALIYCINKQKLFYFWRIVQIFSVGTYVYILARGNQASKIINKKCKLTKNTWPHTYTYTSSYSFF